MGAAEVRLKIIIIEMALEALSHMRRGLAQRLPWEKTRGSRLEEEGM